MSVVSSSSPFQLLEINVISAQDLYPVSKTTRAYAVVWLHPERKLTTRIDETGNTNPTWTEKFVFRVDEDFLNSDTSTIMIEIYATAWLRDVLIGTVGVLVSNLLPPSARSGGRRSKLRFVALQIRRPSGRPQGILNIGVTTLDGTMRSMPLYSKLSASAVGYWDLMDDKKTLKSEKPNQTPQHKQKSNMENHEIRPFHPNLLTLQRSQSERNDSSVNDYNYCGGKQVSVLTGSVMNGGSELGLPPNKVINANGSLCSDVGPSPSVVAAAIAKGLYPIPAAPAASHTTESSGLEEWTENGSTEGVQTKIERWKTGLPPVYDQQLQSYRQPNKTPKTKTPGKTPGRPPKTPGRTTKPNRRNGLFSCFGTALGCEFTITCGGGNSKKRHGRDKHRTPSGLTFDESYVYV